MQKISWNLSYHITVKPQKPQYAKMVYKTAQNIWTVVSQKEQQLQDLNLWPSNRQLCTLTSKPRRQFVRELASALGKNFSCYERFLEMENKGLDVEFWTNLSSQDCNYCLNQPVSWCHLSEDTDGNMLNRQDILNANNIDFLSRVLKDSNMQMRLGKERIAWKASQLWEHRSSFTYFNLAALSGSGSWLWS